MFLKAVSQLVVRASSDDDDKCSKKSNSAECQRPVQSDGLTIGLSVGLPVAAIVIVLGYFLFRNYRKGKKESMEHDPDFDENGEATALPDFPANQYQMEDPFDNRNSMRFPPAGYQHHKTQSTSSFPGRDPYLDNVVLPYQHQTGSKVSLDEYARQLGDINQAYIGSNPLGGARTRGSSISNSQHMSRSTSNLNIKSASVSPAKSNLRHETKNVGASEYANVANHSLSDINDTLNETTLNHTSNQISDSDSDESAMRRDVPKFNINYENESEPVINETLPSTAKDTASEDLPEPTTRDSYSEVNHDDDYMSPFEDKPVAVQSQSRAVPYEERPVYEEDAPYQPKAVSHEAKAYEAKAYETKPQYDDEPIDGDFDFSNDTQSSNQPSGNGQDESQTANTSASNLEIPHSASHRKSPRISAFNLLKNDSDDEDEDKEAETTQNPDEILSADQEEELKRMKSVYKLYFERANSVRRPENDKEEEFQDKYEFKADPNQPLPDVDHLRINDELTTDTNYDKRLTTTSSIYTENPIFTQQEFTQQEQYQHYLQDENFQSFYQQHQQYYEEQQEPLPPLQHLPHPSDIRKSTIQTYTDFQPKIKQSASSPHINRPFVPIENEGVWSSSSPTGSPVSATPPTFGLPNQKPGMKSVPSASQLARASVVMLNPVTEITKQRKFKPAGSLPGGHNNNHAYANYNYSQPQVNNQMYDQNNSSGDLIPNTRKGDIRRVMNNI